MFDPFKAKKKEDNESEEDHDKEDEEKDNYDKEDEENGDNPNDPWIDDDERISNFDITTNPTYNYIRLPQFIKLKNPKPGEISLYQKRSFPKAARFHKKREEKDSHKFFLSELMLYAGYNDEQQLGCDDEDKCR